MSVVRRISEMFTAGLVDVPWPDERHRRQTIIKQVAPIFLGANRPVTPSMIDRFMSETAGLSARETGRKLSGLVDAELERGPTD